MLELLELDKDELIEIDELGDPATEPKSYLPRNPSIV
jgi:hypothetical protein